MYCYLPAASLPSIVYSYTPVCVCVCVGRLVAWPDIACALTLLSLLQTNTLWFTCSQVAYSTSLDIVSCEETKIKQWLHGKFTQILHFTVAFAVALTVASAKLSSNDLMSMFYPKCSNCHVLRAQPEDFIRTTDK